MRTLTQIIFASLAFVPIWGGAQPALDEGDPEKVAESLQQARAALSDGLYTIAEKQFRAVLADQGMTNETLRCELELRVADCLIGQKRHVAAATYLAPMSERLALAGKQVGGVQRIARARLLNGEPDRALRWLDPLPEDVRSPATKDLRVRCLVALGRYPEALDLREAMGADSALEGAARNKNLLDRAALLLQMEKPEPAVKLLSELAAGPLADASVQQGCLLLAREYFTRQRYDLARQTLEAFVAEPERKNIPVPRSQEALELLAAISEREEGGGEAALELLAQAVALPTDEATRARLEILRAKLLIHQGKIEKGAELLRAQIPAGSGEWTMADAQLYLAQAQLEVGSHAEAAEAFQAYLEAFDDEGGQAPARLGQAWAYLELGRIDEALRGFEKVALMTQDPERSREALFKTGDVEFLRKNYAEARSIYLRYTRRYPGNDRLPQALFQAALCRDREGSHAEAIREYQRLATLFPDAPYAERATLAIPYAREALHEYEVALEGFGDYLRRYPQGEHALEALLDRGLAAYRLGQFADALADFSQVTSSYPESPLAERAFFMSGWSQYLLGKDEEALAICAQFIARYPQSDWAGEVLFWMAEYHYNHRAYPEAEELFADLVTRFPSSLLTEKALFWAGRSASAAKEYLRAIDYFGQLVDQFPKSERVPDALFYQGDASALLGQFDVAILVFNRIIEDHPQSYLVHSAWGRKGDCQFTLASEDAERFEEAVRSFQTVIDAADVAPELQLQAQYKLATTYQKMDQLDAALEHYSAVVYRYLAQRKKLGGGSAIWFTRAGFAATEILEKRQDWRGAMRIYRRIVQAGLAPSAQEAEERFQKIRVEHLILFE